MADHLVETVTALTLRLPQWGVLLVALALLGVLYIYVLLPRRSADLLSWWKLFLRAHDNDEDDPPRRRRDDVAGRVADLDAAAAARRKTPSRYRRFVAALGSAAWPSVSTPT